MVEHRRHENRFRIPRTPSPGQADNDLALHVAPGRRQVCTHPPVYPDHPQIADDLVSNNVRRQLQCIENLIRRRARQRRIGRASRNRDSAEGENDGPTCEERTDHQLVKNRKPPTEPRPHRMTSETATRCGFRRVGGSSVQDAQQLANVTDQLVALAPLIRDDLGVHNREPDRASEDQSKPDSADRAEPPRGLVARKLTFTIQLPRVQRPNEEGHRQEEQDEGEEHEASPHDLGGLLDNCESLSGARPIDAEGPRRPQRVAVPQPLDRVIDAVVEQDPERRRPSQPSVRGGRTLSAWSRPAPAAGSWAGYWTTARA